MTALLAAAALAVGGVPHNSTSYCLHGRMADGTQTRVRSAAHNGYPLGTRIWVEPAVRGIHRWVVRDRIGSGTQLDLWTPSCSAAIAYGRRTVRVWKGWRHSGSHPLDLGVRAERERLIAECKELKRCA